MTKTLIMENMKIYRMSLNDTLFQCFSEYMNFSRPSYAYNGNAYVGETTYQMAPGYVMIWTI